CRRAPRAGHEPQKPCAAPRSASGARRRMRRGNCARCWEAPRRASKVLCQSRDLGLLRPSLNKPGHVEQVLTTEAGAVFRRQLSRQRRDNLVAVLRARVAEDIAPYPLPDLPIEHDEFRVDGSRHTKARILDQTPKIGGQLIENSRI